MLDREITLPMNSIKIALGIEYNGSRFYGWQRQPEIATVQSALEVALSKVANAPITLFCAGRTDAGVHATGQVVHFTTDAVRSDVAWTMGVNAHLPSTIAVRWAKRVEPHFHARFSALARRYHYIIFNQRVRPAILAQKVTHCALPLDVKKMAAAGQCLLGENDFSAFRSAQCQSLTPWRNIHHINITRLRDYIVVDIQANAFVHHMVRNIVGSLLEIGYGHQNENWLAALLASKDRTQAAATAKAAGLYLVAVNYPANFLLPETAVGPFFLA